MAKKNWKDEVATKGYVHDMADIILQGMQRMFNDQKKMLDKKFQKIEKGQRKLEKGQKRLENKFDELPLNYTDKKEFRSLRSKVYRHHPSN